MTECHAHDHAELNAMAGGCPYCHEEPAFIIGRGLAHWADHPPTDTPEQREVAAVEYRRVIDIICRNWNLEIRHKTKDDDGNAQSVNP